MPANKKTAESTCEDVHEIYQRAFSCLHVVEQHRTEWEPGMEIHRTSLTFSRMFGHLYKKGLLDAKTLNEFLTEMGVPARH